MGAWSLVKNSKSLPQVGNQSNVWFGLQINGYDAWFSKTYKADGFINSLKDATNKVQIDVRTKINEPSKSDEWNTCKNKVEKVQIYK